MIKNVVGLFVLGLFIAQFNDAAAEAHPPPKASLRWTGLPLSRGERRDMPYPILVLATDTEFGTYTSEILKAEGFNGFEIHPLTSSTVTSGYLKKFDVVILSENSLTDKLQEIFVRYVKEGGNLIAFRPDKKLDDVFGIISKGSTLNEAYILINVHTEIGKGIASQTLQFHGEADKADLMG